MGSHICPGMYLAKMELTILFEDLLEQVDHFVITEAERMPHNTLRGLSKLSVTAVPAAT
jgi:cytochrome P450